MTKQELLMLYDEALRAYERAHAKWMNTYVWTNEAETKAMREAWQALEICRKAYQEAV